MRKGVLIAMFLGSMLCFIPQLPGQQAMRINPEQKYSLADTTIAKEYFAKAARLSIPAKYDSSDSYLAKAASIYGQLAEEYDTNALWGALLKCYNWHSDNLWRCGKYEEALRTLDKVLKIGIEKFGESHIEIAEAYLHIGTIFIVRGNYKTALVKLKQSLDIRQTLYGSDAHELAACYQRIGEVYRLKGNFEHALRFLERSLLLYIKRFGENDRTVASMHSNIATIYLDKGDYERALIRFQKSLRVHERSGHNKSDSIALTYNNIALAYNGLGDYQRALAFFNKSLSINIDLFGAEHMEASRNYLNIGNSYWHLGDFDKALEFYQKSLSADIVIFGEAHKRVALRYDRIGSIYQSKGDFDTALNYFFKALEIDLQILDGNHLQVATDYASIGFAYLEKQEHLKAISYYNKAIAIAINLVGKIHPLIAQSYRGLAEVYFQKNRLVKALEYCQLSITSNVPEFEGKTIDSNPQFDMVSPEPELVKTLRLKARIYAERAKDSSLEDLKTAHSTYWLATDLIDKMRIGYKSEGSKFFLAESALEIYEEGIDVALRLYNRTGDKAYQKAAFQFAEKGKAGILHEAQKEIEAKTFAGIPDSLLTRERDLKINLAYYKTKLNQERQKKTEERNEEQIENVQERFFALKSEYGALIETFEQNYPKYYELKYQTTTVSIPDLQENLDSITTAVEYFIGEENIYIFTIRQKFFDVTTVPKSAKFEMMVEDLRESLAQVTGAYEEYITNARGLYRILIEPIENHLATEHIILIPDPAIANLPFEALLSKDTQNAGISTYESLPYLLKERVISYVYSAKLLMNLLSTSGDYLERDYLGFAPVFPNGLETNSRVLEFVKLNRNLDSARAPYIAKLAASRDEVIGIQRLFRKSYSTWDKVTDWLFDEKARVYLEDEANEENLKNTPLRDYRYLHFATHGFANQEARISPDCFSRRISTPKKMAYSI